MIELDPSIIDQESLRKKRRKKMFLVALVPIIILILASILFLRPGVFDMIFSAAYKGIDAGGAISISQFHKNLNIIEPYLAPYNAGTAYLKDKNGASAETEFRDSLRLGPPKNMLCQIRVNLSYSIELQADEAKNRNDYDQALILYNKAEGALYEDDCAKKNQSENEQGGKDEKANAAKQRISDKRSVVVAAMNGVIDGDNDDNNFSNDHEISDQDVQELREQLIDGSTLRDAVNDAQHRMNSWSGIKHW